MTEKRSNDLQWYHGALHPWWIPAQCKSLCYFPSIVIRKKGRSKNNLNKMVDLDVHFDARNDILKKIWKDHVLPVHEERRGRQGGGLCWWGRSGGAEDRRRGAIRVGAWSSGWHSRQWAYSRWRRPGTGARHPVEQQSGTPHVGAADVGSKQVVSQEQSRQVPPAVGEPGQRQRPVPRRALGCTSIHMNWGRLKGF